MLWCICGVGFIQSKNNRRELRFLYGQLFSSSLTYWDDIRSFAFHSFPPPDQTQRAHTQPNQTHVVKHFSERETDLDSSTRWVWCWICVCRLTWFFNDCHWMSFLPGTMETVSFSQDTTLTYSWTTEGMRHLNTATLPRMERWSATRTV